MCHYRTHARQTSISIRPPGRRGRVTRATPRARALWQSACCGRVHAVPRPTRMFKFRRGSVLPSLRLGQHTRDRSFGGDRARKLACCGSLKRRWSTLDRLDGPARAAPAAELFNDCGEPLLELIEILEEVLFRQNRRNNMHCLKLVDLVLRKSDNKYP
jgi:hypothetical protein